MQRPIVRVLAVFVASLGAFGCGYGYEPARYPDPPAESYREMTMTVRAGGEAETVKGARVTSGFFEVPRAVPLLGRSFTPAEYGQAANATAMISEDYWKKRFAGAPEIIGRRIEVDGRELVVVGVGPPGFAPSGTQIWLAGDQ